MSEANKKKVVVVGALAGAAVAVVAARAVRRAVRAYVERSADREIAALLCSGPVKLRWDVPRRRVPALAAALVRRSRATLDAVVAAHARGELTWAATLGRVNRDDAEFGLLESCLTFPGHVAPDKGMRDAATEADQLLSAYANEAASREDVYKACVAFSETAEASALDGEEARMLERTLRDFRRRGLHLDAATAARVREINGRLSELGITYQKNLGEEAASFDFTAAELDGCPSSYLAERLQPDGATYRCTLKYPCYVPLMENCRVAATRRTMEFAFNCRCKDENGAILETLVELRHEKAKLMGYATHAAFVTEVRMSGGAAAVKDFLGGLAAKLRPLLESDVAALKELKKAELGDAAFAADGATLHAWDRAYYCKRLEEAQYEVDHEALREYFPLEAVLEGLLGIYQELLGLRFARDPALEGAAAWHEDVQAFAVHDAASAAPVGWFYLDLHPRAGKYGHAACFGLQPACEDACEDASADFDVDGGGARAARRQLPVAACVCNFPKATSAAPALLQHREVETFFHEFGHVMHQLCSRARLVHFAGTRVERDFVEAPSQMLENWCWQPAALHRMSRHHETGAPIPEPLLAALLRSRHANQGVLNMRQVVLGTFDQAIHTAASCDSAAELARVTDELMGVPATPGTNMAASFGHLAGGYDAQYYGYMWSEVFSADMFASRFEAEGIFNPVTGASYRAEVLAPGGSRDASESLRAFLGRDPIQEPFLRSKGLAV